MFSWKAQLMHAVTIASASTSTASRPHRSAHLSAALSFPAARGSDPQQTDFLRQCSGSTQRPSGTIARSPSANYPYSRSGQESCVHSSRLSDSLPFISLAATPGSMR